MTQKACADHHWLFVLQKWVELWTQVMTDVTSDPITAGHTMVDILNEPDSKMIR